MNTFLWKPLDEKNIADPYGMYAELRRTDPVHRAQTGEFIITRYEDIKYVLKNPSFESGNRLLWLKKGIQYFDNKEEDFRAIYQAMNAFILMLNAEHHHRMRTFISKAWNDRDIDTLIMNNIRVALNAIEGPEFDFVADYAQPLPVRNIADILGIPVTDYQHLMQLGVAMTKTLDLYVTLKDLVTMNEASRSFIEYFREQIRTKQASPDDGLLSKLIRKNVEEKCGLTEEELISIGIFLFTAGEETSAGLISNAVLQLCQHPEQLRRLRTQPQLLDSAVEEVLRYDSVVQLLGRVAKDDVIIRGKLIPAGSAVTLVVASGNRDEGEFDAPDLFDIGRQPNRHLSFGTGVHYCLGDWLGRKQSQMALRAFLDRFEEIRIPRQKLQWYKNIAVRRLSGLTVTCS